MACPPIRVTTEVWQTAISSSFMSFRTMRVAACSCAARYQIIEGRSSSGLELFRTVGHFASTAPKMARTGYLTEKRTVITRNDKNGEKQYRGMRIGRERRPATLKGSENASWPALERLEHGCQGFCCLRPWVDPTKVHDSETAGVNLENRHEYKE